MTATVPGTIRRRVDLDEPIQADKTPHKPAHHTGRAGGRHGSQRQRRAIGETTTAWGEGTPACGPDSDYPPDLFWPTGPTDVRALAARAVCAGCPVRQGCLDYAEAAHEPTDPKLDGGGIWGGLTGPERVAARQKGWKPGDPAPPLKRLTLNEQALALDSEWAAYLPERVLRAWGALAWAGRRTA